MGWRTAAQRAVLTGLLLACGWAVPAPWSAAAAQDKPSALGQPTEAPDAQYPASARPPATAATGETDKFGLPPRREEATQGAVAPSAPAPAPPADEPATIRTLRALLGPEARLRYGAAEVTDPARGAVRLRDVTIARPGETTTIEELSLDGLREDGVAEASARNLVGREPDGTLARIERLAIRDLALIRPPGGGDPGPGDVRLGALRLEGLSIEGDSPLAIGALVVEDHGTGRTSRVEIEGFEFRDPGGPGATGPVDRISLGRLSLRGLDLAGTLAAMGRQESPPRPDGAWALEVEEVALAGEGRRIGSLERLRLEGEVPATGLDTGRLTLRGVRVEPFPGLAAWLERFGYQALVADLTAETRYDPATGRLELTSLSLAGQDIGAIDLSMVLEGMTPEALETQDLDGLRLLAFTLRFRDQSLFQRFVRQQARESRQGEAAVREALATQAGAALGGRGPDGAALAPIRDAIQRFLRGEAREVEITARPPRPVPLNDLGGSATGGAAEAQRLLGLGASAR